MLVEQSRLTYNHRWPHGVLGCRTRAPFMRGCLASAAAGEVAFASTKTG